MRNSAILSKVYCDIMNETLNPNDFESKLIMQKTTYLLSELGVTIDNYKFAWDIYGPFSQKLQNEINSIEISTNISNIKFSSDAKDKINFLKSMLNANDTKYSNREWLESIASCLFLKKYMYPQYSWNQIVDNLQQLKSHLQDNQANMKAVNWCQKIINYPSKII